MKGIYSVGGDIQIVDNDLLITQDIEVLTNELYNFLNVRAAHVVDNKIIYPGEAIEDQNFGLDHIILTESDLENIKAYVSRQILRYFSDRITEITEINLVKNQYTRELSIDFIVKTIYKESIKMGVKI